MLRFSIEVPSCATQNRCEAYPHDVGYNEIPCSLVDVVERDCSCINKNSQDNDLNGGQSLQMKCEVNLRPCYVDEQLNSVYDEWKFSQIHIRRVILVMFKTQTEQGYVKCEKIFCFFLSLSFYQILTMCLCVGMFICEADVWYKILEVILSHFSSEQNEVIS
jgi:hypothetical protein